MARQAPGGRPRKQGQALRGGNPLPGNRQYLVVAAYGEKKYLIGVCVGRISLLAPLDDAANPPPA